ncbi:AAA family ATPase [Larkinella bovis]|uniref:AAA family ATPase n=1 Tax=Larkinella bovis TaxID=683041 RepID=A0ABW0I9C4_9BACT
MVRIILNEKYKSLLGQIDIVMPDFTIISGVNGAGKSHLLKAIEEKIAKVYDEAGQELNPIRYVNSTSLAPNDSFQVNRDHFINEVNNVQYAINAFIGQRRNQPDVDFFKFINSYNAAYGRVIPNLVTSSGKPLEEITQEDIREHMPLFSNLVQDIFYQNFSAVFKRYSDRYDDNVYYEYLSKVKKKKKKYLTEEEFLAKYGPPPWEFVNRIFEEANIGYSINDPIEDERDLPYFFKLVNKSNNAYVNFQDLSSGEKVLMSLTLAIYNSKMDIDFPKVLMLDEPDAPLHPSMAKQLLRVIEEVFVKEKGVKVIMTTHSPSTVAMAPEGSLYIMQKSEPRILPKSKEQIMKLLTEGIPSFSVYADSRRQVFVESDVDVYFYSKVYDKLKKRIQSDKSLYFISSGLIKGNTGNSDQEKKNC